MADTKITALAAIATVDPAADVLPIVDISDTSMAASGTTKKVTSNQILGAGGTATLASATITGDLTVDTSTLKVDSTLNKVGIGVATLTGLSTLNVAGDIALTSDLVVKNSGGTAQGYIFGSSGLNYRVIASNPHVWQEGGTDLMRLNSTGLGIGVTPSAWASGYKAIQGQAGGFALSNDGSNNNQFRLSSNAYFDTTDSRWEYYGASTATAYEQRSGEHRFFNAVSGSANAAITFTQAMTLDASGNLLVGTASVLNGARVSIKTASVTSALSLNGVAGDTAQESLVINKFDSDSTTSQVFVRFTNNNGSGGSGQINGNGASQAAFGSFSDSRLKENILSLPSQLANILSLRPVEFDYKDGSGHQIGFVAQEIQEVYSDAVGEQNGFLTVTGWSKTEARLVSAIKELAAKVQALEAKLA